MNIRKLASLSRRYFISTHLGVLAGVAVATAVLVGALVVGDSVRGSLRDLALDRLGNIDQVIVTKQPFRSELATEIANANSVKAAPIWILPSSLSFKDGADRRNLNRMTALGVDERYWKMDDLAQSITDQAGFSINNQISTESGLSTQQEVLLRLPTFEALPADSTLGERVDTSISSRAPIEQVLPPGGIADFQLQASQMPVKNVFLNLQKVNSLLGFESSMANAIVIHASEPNQQITLRPKLEDYGLCLEDLDSSTLFQLESDSLVLPDHVVESVIKRIGSERCYEGITYLANLIQVNEKSIPYSTVTGVDALESVGKLKENEIALNRWAADDLEAQVGDTVTLTYYEPESTHGQLTEARPISFKLVKIIELMEGDQPTDAADPRLAPRLEGVSDAESINNWDLPFDLVHEIRKQDEDYWDEYSTTPKAFISLEQARQLWSTRWGSTSWLRMDSNSSLSETSESLSMAIDPAEFGFEPRKIRQEVLKASSGSTPFDVLFLMFSMFLIASAMMLISLLVRLTVDEKAKQLGLLGAFGFNQQRIMQFVLQELLPIIVVGVFLGIAVGVLYAIALISALETVWIDAIVNPFLEVHLSSLTLLMGGLVSFTISYFTIRSTIKRKTKTPSRILLAGNTLNQTAVGKKSTQLVWRLLPIGFIALACSVAYFGKDLKGESAAGAFFGVGSLVLVALLTALANWLSNPSVNNQSFSMARLAFSNLARAGNRTLITIGLTAAACFMILATSVFRLSPTYQGTGGFSHVIESSQSIYHDLNSDEGRYELGFKKKEEAELDKWHFYPFRMESGQDASCQNLFQANRPQLLGATKEFIQYGGFEWAEFRPEFEENPWLALESSEPKDSIPVVLDYNTAVYAMKLYGGVGSQFIIQDEFGKDLQLEIVGLLKNSMLQGVVVMDETNLVEHFPSISGYKFFLSESVSNRDGAELVAARESIANLLNNRLVDYGVSTELSSDRLAGYLSVQNTYLSTFQALGALGILLGAIGLTIAQYRNLGYRCGELALMRSSGFTNQRLMSMVMIENLWQLGLGVAMGAIAAMVAVTPLARLLGTSFPWITVLLLVLGTLVIGHIGARWATSRVLKSPILQALRAD